MLPEFDRIIKILSHDPIYYYEPVYDEELKNIKLQM